MNVDVDDVTDYLHGLQDGVADVVRALKTASILWVVHKKDVGES